MIEVTDTVCCAVDILCRLDNHTSPQEISKTVEDVLLDEDHGYDDEIADGPTTMICFTTPEEKPLEENLKKAGFRKLTNLQRRVEVAHQRGSGRKPLTMWIIHRRWIKKAKKAQEAGK
jgi:hypothetical protein